MLFEIQSESTLLFFYIIIYQRCVSFEPPSSTLGEDRHMRSRTFLYEIQFRITFFWTFFWYDGYFWQHRAPKWIYFSFFYIKYFKNAYISSPLSPLWWEIRHMHSWTFLYEIQLRTTFIRSFFCCDVYFW